VVLNSGAQKIYRFKVRLLGISPPTWRRLEVPASLTLADLNEVLVTAFDWSGTAPCRFEQQIEDVVVAFAGPVLRQTLLGELFSVDGEKALYVYDLTENWRHEVVLEKALSPRVDVVYPRCTGGRCAAPPEGSGGLRGYKVLLDVLADRDHPDHAVAVAEFGRFDPRFFDLDEINGELKSLPHPGLHRSPS
jgi:hypothetical protein